MSTSPINAVAAAAATEAVLYVLRRLKADPRLAYLMGPGSEAFERLMVAGAAITQQELDPYREMFLSLECQPVPGIGKVGAVVGPEELERIAVYDDKAHDLDDQDDLNMLVNHFVRRGLDVAEAERDTQTEELF